MILVDSRVGSVELIPLFKPYGVDVCEATLEFGDVCWTGNGPDGAVAVGVERKTLHDLVGSMRTKRLSGHQLPGLMRDYQYVYLVVEGIMQAGNNGQADIWIRGTWRPLLTGSTPILFREIDHYLATLQHVCGVTVRNTANPQQTVAWIVSQYKWWEKEWKHHHSHEAVYAPGPDVMTRRGRVRFGSRAAGLVEKVAAQLPGVDRKAFAVGKRFKSVRAMVAATEQEWAKVEGIGKKMANTIVRALGGE